MNIRRLVFFVIVLGVFLPVSFVFAGTILSSYKYAWSNYSGYINFERVAVSDTALSGYAWAANHGWIKFDSSLSGVTNDGQGNLSGYAWGENLGYINFDNVSISTSTGRFFGLATGTLVGTINFDCPNYCDVRTDWRPTGTQECASWTYSDWSVCSNGQQNRNIISSLPGGCAGGGPILSQSCVSGNGVVNIAQYGIKPTHVEVVNNNLVIDPDQSGKYTEDTAEGKVVLEVPINNLTGRTVFIITREALNPENSQLLFDDYNLVNSAFYNVVAKDVDGNFVHSFPSFITIILPIPANLIGGKNLGVYYLSESSNAWVLIPEAVFAGNQVSFRVNHLSKFAIFSFQEEDNFENKESKQLGEIKKFLNFPASKFRTSTAGQIVTSTQNIDEEKAGFFNKVKNFFAPIISKFQNKTSVSSTEFSTSSGKVMPTSSLSQKGRAGIFDYYFFCWLLLVVLVLLIIKRMKRTKK